ncbi:enoyl-CoA hydratase-related protein [Alicyclobacillus ferrooxydans]|uniref:Enoyl-CoA hydratase n=1 Tax=Alicyclobacillus ferrooxydans TaxID=471514 RepID=A0A0P9CXR6_9BACL|nr:enoyl-CoA hydratase-related protein [Alicyclobacillus ferrooxydans]KPV44559.1 enoyl-CoA hydratase [Alicyclobacillus ferrooxydans]
MSLRYIHTEINESVALVRIERHEVLNALNLHLMNELVGELARLDADDSVRCMVVTGGPKAFAAGADILEMADATVVEMKQRNQFQVWDRLRQVRKPVIAAVNGFALGGGCELAMACDMIVAGEDAKFGQPEVKLGVMPGAGGTQRLTRLIGKNRALEMLLTGRPISADDALNMGLVNRVVPAETCVQEALSLAYEIAKQAPIAVQMIKEAANKALDVDLQTGMELERNAFYLLFATEDRSEGMKAFLDKRKPVFRGR